MELVICLQITNELTQIWNPASPSIYFMMKNLLINFTLGLWKGKWGKVRDEKLRDLFVYSVIVNQLNT
jgi:hypothetical protein